MQNKNIYIASDHAGFDLKTKLLKNFPKINDLGTKTDESVDYPDFAHKLTCLLYTSPSPRDRLLSRMPSSA